MYNIAVLSYRVFHDTAPRYLGPLTRVTDIPGRRAVEHSAVPAPIVWNYLISNFPPSAAELFRLPSHRSGTSSSSSRMRVIYHNWSATKQCPHPQSVAEISRHSVLSEDRIQQCKTSSQSRHKDTDQCLIVAISFCRHRSVPVLCENGSAETTVAEGGRNLVAGLWGHTLGEN